MKGVVCVAVPDTDLSVMLSLLYDSQSRKSGVKYVKTSVHPITETQEERNQI